MADDQNGTPSGDAPRKRRVRYSGTHPKRFAEKYKELDPAKYPEIIEQVRARGMTPAGRHVPVMLREAVDALSLRPGMAVADGTLGFGGHSERVLEAIGPSGRLIAIDHDGDTVEKTKARLGPAYPNARFHHSSFAGIGKIMAAEGLSGFDGILLDLGVSSMQIDDPRRGFTLRESAPLDMRMDQRRKETAADLIAKLSAEKLTQAFREYADAEDAAVLARAIVREREKTPIRTTDDLSRLVLEARGLTPGGWRRELGKSRFAAHPAAPIFQALRILVNDEFGALREFLRQAPFCLLANGRLSIITFHSGEEKIVRRALQEHAAAGLILPVAAEPLRPSRDEVRENPRARSARLFSAVRAEPPSA